MKKILLILVTALCLLSCCACTDKEEKSTASSDILISDNNYIKFSIIDEYIDTDDDENQIYVLKVAVVNKTENNLTVAWDHTMINGCLCDPFWGMELAPGETDEEEICFSEDLLKAENLPLEGAKTISFVLNALNMDGHDIDPLVAEPSEFNTADLHQ